MNWRDYWNGQTSLYVSCRHKRLHDRFVARDIGALIPFSTAIVLDYGCGDNSEAEPVSLLSGKLYLCDGAPHTRETLTGRYAANAKIQVLSPEEFKAVPDACFDVVVAHSLLQYLSRTEVEALLESWRAKLADQGTLILSDIVPPDASALDDAADLLSFAWKGGFFIAAAIGLVRTALSDYTKLRRRIGLSHYSETEIVDMLRKAGFEARRLPRNIGHNQKRMAFASQKRIISDVPFDAMPVPA